MYPLFYPSFPASCHLDIVDLRRRMYAATGTGLASTLSGSPVVVLGVPDTNTVDQTQWVESGTGRIKLLGIGHIAPSPLGRRRLLEESITLMRSLGAWGISRIYGQLLTRLQAE